MRIYSIFINFRREYDNKKKISNESYNQQQDSYYVIMEIV
jgi:hypothetical protein